MSNATNNRQIVDEALSPIIDNLTNKLGLNAAVSEELVAAVNKNFDTEGERLGSKWQALRPATIRQKRKQNRADKILQSRVQLLKSIIGGATEEYAAAGTNLAYAGIHNFGGDIDIPARKRTIRHRTNAKGNLLTQKEHLLIFAGSRHKRVREREVNQGAYKIHLPQREFLALADEDYPIIGNAVTQFLLGK